MEDNRFVQFFQRLMKKWWWVEEEKIEPIISSPFCVVSTVDNKNNVPLNTDKIYRIEQTDILSINGRPISRRRYHDKWIQAAFQPP